MKLPNNHLSITDSARMFLAGVDSKPSKHEPKESCALCTHCETIGEPCESYCGQTKPFDHFILQA